MKTRKAAVIVNPNSAHGKTGKRWPGIEQMLRRHLGPLTTRFSEHPGRATAIARELLETGFDLIVAVGGDGTFSETANGFFRDDKPVRPGACFAVLPAGSGMDFARALGIPRNMEAAIGALGSAAPVAIDVGKARFESAGKPTVRYFILMASFGLGGEVALRRRTLPGTPGYLVAALAALRRVRPFEVRLHLDSGAEPIELRVIHVGAGNGPYHGGGMRVCPAAKMNDGLIDITAIQELSARDVLFSLPTLYSGAIYRHPKVRHFRAARLYAAANRPTPLELDGEPVGTLPVELTILPRSLNVLALNSSRAAMIS